MKWAQTFLIAVAVMMSYFFSNINILGWVLLPMVLKCLTNGMRSDWEKEKKDGEEAIEKELKAIEMRSERERESFRKWESQQE